MTMLNLELLFPNPLDRHIVLPLFKVGVQFTNFVIKIVGSLSPNYGLP